MGSVTSNVVGSVVGDVVGDVTKNLIKSKIYCPICDNILTKETIEKSEYEYDIREIIEEMNKKFEIKNI